MGMILIMADQMTLRPVASIQIHNVQRVRVSLRMPGLSLMSHDELHQSFPRHAK